jgi:hypothetical protein
MRPGLLPDKFFDVECCALPRVERAGAFVQLRAQRPKLLDMRQKPPTYLLLIRVWKRSDFRNCLFECLHHAASIALGSLSIK